MPFNTYFLNMSYEPSTSSLQSTETIVQGKGQGAIRGDWRVLTAEVRSAVVLIKL
jgi:hypothetical protein